MSHITRTLKDLMACRSGASALEYALFVSLISLGIVGVSMELGDGYSGMYSSTDTEIQEAAIAAANVAPASGGKSSNRNNPNKNNQGKGKGKGAN